MSKSYRIRTKLGTDQNIRVNIEQDFDFLEILSLKLKQEDVYSQFCADYGIVVGRVVANSGFGIQNAKVSIFVPVEDMDLQDPVISALYPYKSPVEKNEDGYRYNLLPYDQQYKGHTPTGTFPNREDVLTRSEVLEIYEKYYKYTVKTNDSGDFMITGVPLGNQKIVMDLDLSDMGCFSMRPQDLIRMNLGVQEQFDGTNFKASSNLESLPQIINQVKDIDVTPFWGQEDLCNIGITRTDFDLRSLGIEVEPTAVYMGSIFSDSDNRPIKPNCKPRTEQGDQCGLVTGPGEILAVRQTIDFDEQGDPILEQYKLPNGGKVIDENGAFVVDIPMNLDYVVTNEYGDIVLSNDPSIGVPTKGKYRFKMKYQSEENGPAQDEEVFFPIRGEIQRGNFIVPQIREHGWSGNTINPGVDPITKDSISTSNVNFFDVTKVVSTKTVNIPAGKSVHVKRTNEARKVEVFVNNVKQTQKWIDFPNGGTLTIEVQKKINMVNQVPNGQSVSIELEFYDYDYVQLQKSYAFSLDWNDYADKTSAIDCKDSFYLMNYNKVYTPSQLIDEYRKGYGRARFLGIKEVLDRGCESDTNKFPVNDGVRNFDLIFFIVNILLSIFTPVLFTLTLVGHVICFLWPILYRILNFVLVAIFAVINSIIKLINAIRKLFGSKKKSETYKAPKMDKKCPLSAIPLPNLSYPECQACDCEGREAGENTDNLPEVEENSTILIDTNVDSYYDNLVGYHDGEQDEWDKYLSGFQTVMAGNDLWENSEQQAMTPWLSGDDNPSAKAKTWSRDLPLSERFNLFNVKSKYHQFGGQNRIDTYVNPVTNNYKKHSDNVIMLLLDPGQLKTFTSGQIVTFQNPENSSDPNISGGTTGTTVFQTQSTSTVNVTYMDPYTLTSRTQSYVITGQTQSSQKYEHPTDIEYFQVITGQTLSEFENSLSSVAKGKPTYATPNSTLGQFYIFGWQKVIKFYSGTGNKNPDVYPDGATSGDYFDLEVPNIKLNSDWENHCVVFLVRGVDPHTPRQDIKYDLSKLYGYSMGTGPQVRGNFKMNIPIQPYNSNTDWRLPRHNQISTNGKNCLDTQLPIYFNSFSFTPNNGMYQTYKNKNTKYYSALDSTQYKFYKSTVETENQAIRTRNYPGSWGQMEGSPGWNFNYRNNEVVEGGSLMQSKNNDDDYSQKAALGNGDWSYSSPVYYNTLELQMLNSSKIVMRTDRLPTSDNVYKRFQLHQNKRFAIYTVTDDGETTSFSTGIGDSFGDGSDDFNEDAGSISSAITSTFSCEGMVPLECYTGNGETIGVEAPDNRCYYVDNKKEIKKMYKGCYYLITKNFAISEDFQSIAEWKARFRMMFALCNNVVSLSFVNNWVNGTLYMYAFQKDDIYGNKVNETKFLSNPDYRYCNDTIIYQTQNNSFFYRATPYNNGFIGRDGNPQTNILGRSNASNNKFLGNPTTLMDLGPRDEFTKEICFNPEFQGYIVDTIKTSSYNDTSDLLQLFVISRLTGSGFWSQVLGLGDSSIQKLFSRPNSRIDGDIAQLLSINSEYGTIPYLGTNYSEDDVLFTDDVNGNATLGVFYQANTVNRDMISPGRFTFSDTISGFLVDNYGHTDQEVPFYKWNLTNTNTIFGDEMNDWLIKNQSGGIDSINYQSIDRTNNGHGYHNYGVTLPTSESPGFIYNSKLNNNTIEPDSTKGNRPSRFMVGSPYFFYFGLKKGSSSMNKYIDKFILNQDIL